MSRFVRTFPSVAPSVGVLIFLTGYTKVADSPRFKVAV